VLCAQPVARQRSRQNCCMLSRAILSSRCRRMDETRGSSSWRCASRPLSRADVSLIQSMSPIDTVARAGATRGSTATWNALADATAAREVW
jgi:hypothetical protein